MYMLGCDIWEISFELLLLVVKEYISELWSGGSNCMKIHETGT